MTWKCRSCGKTFELSARISFEKATVEFNPQIKRVIVEKPCCPFCESIEFDEVKPSQEEKQK